MINFVEIRRSFSRALRRLRHGRCSKTSNFCAAAAVSNAHLPYGLESEIAPSYDSQPWLPLAATTAKIHAQSSQYVPYRQLTCPSPPSPSLQPADGLPAKLREVFKALGALAHIRFAICGPIALQLWGMPYQPSLPFAALVDAVTIACPSSSRDVLVAWALCMGFSVDRRCLLPPFLGVPVGPSRRCVLVHIRWEDGSDGSDEYATSETFSAVWDIATLPLAGGVSVPVLSLPALAHRAAQAFAHGVATGTDRAELDPIAQSLVWILQQLARARSQASSTNVDGSSCDTARLPALLNPMFYVAFSHMYTEAPQLLASAGLPLHLCE